MGANILLMLTLFLLVLGLQNCIGFLSGLPNPIFFPAAQFFSVGYFVDHGAFQEHIGGGIAGTSVYVPFPSKVSF